MTIYKEFQAAKIPWRIRVKLFFIRMQRTVDFTENGAVILYYKELKGVMYIFKEETR